MIKILNIISIVLVFIYFFMNLYIAIKKSSIEKNKDESDV